MSNIKDICCNSRLHDLVLAGWPPCCAKSFVVVRRRRRWAHAPVFHAASHFDHKKRVAWVPISMHTCGSFFYNYGAPFGGPSGRRSSAIIFQTWFFSKASFQFLRGKNTRFNHSIVYLLALSKVWHSNRN